MKTKLLTIAMTAAFMLTAMTKVQAQNFDSPCLPQAHGLLEDQSAMCGITQTIALVDGINYVSFNVEITLDELKAALLEALPGTNSIVINSQGGANTTYNGIMWRGTLNSLDMAQMYMVNVTNNCQLTVQGMLVDPAEHPISIVNGNKWMSFPLTQSMALTNAFAGFAIANDMIYSQTGSSTYTGIMWRGAVGNLEPGKGYIYKSSVDRTFTFPQNAR